MWISGKTSLSAGISIFYELYKPLKFCSNVFAYSQAIVFQFCGFLVSVGVQGKKIKPLHKLQNRSPQQERYTMFHGANQGFPHPSRDCIAMIYAIQSVSYQQPVEHGIIQFIRPVTKRDNTKFLYSKVQTSTLFLST